ncbi:hypothetical protein [Rhizobacter sp. P5_C2]
MGRRSGMLVVMGMVGLLAACGGGGGGGTSAATDGGSTGGGGTVVTPTPVPTVATGWWNGSTDDHRTLTGLVFSDGSFSILYSAQDAPDSVAGLVQGTGAGVDGAFNSTATVDFSLADGTVTATQLSATVVAAQRFDGNLSADAPAFSMTYNPAYERTASLDDVAGSYDAQAARPDDSLSVALTIDAQGVLIGSGTGCRVAGTLTPRSDANAFDIVLALSGDDCASNGSAFGGIAFFDADARRLSVMAPNTARADALVVRAARTD